MRKDMAKGPNASVCAVTSKISFSYIPGTRPESSLVAIRGGSKGSVSIRETALQPHRPWAPSSASSFGCSRCGWAAAGGSFTLSRKSNRLAAGPLLVSKSNWKTFQGGRIYANEVSPIASSTNP